MIFLLLSGSSCWFPRKDASHLFCAKLEESRLPLSHAPNPGIVGQVFSSARTQDRVPGHKDKNTRSKSYHAPAPWVPGCEGNFCFSNVPMCLMSDLCISVSLVSGVRCQETQVPASRVSSLGPKSATFLSTRRVPRIWGYLKAAMKIHRISSQSAGLQ